MSADHPNDRSTERRGRLARAALPTGIIVVGLLLRLSLLGEPMRYDEAFTLDHYAVHSYRFIAPTYDYPNNHVLYTLLTHTVWLLAGDHVWTVRVPAFLAGVAIIPATYLAGRELYGERAAIWAAVLAATYAPLVDYSVNGRGYTLGILFVLLLIPLGTALLRRSRRSSWAGFVLCAALAVYTVPTMAYGVATVALWLGAIALLGSSPQAHRFITGLLVALAVAAGLALMLYAPVLGQPGWTVVHPLPSDLTHVLRLVRAIWGDWNRGAPAPLNWLIALACVVGLISHRRLARQPVPLLAAAVVILCAVVVTGQTSPFARSWLYLAPLYLITAAAGFTWLANRAGSLAGRPELVNAGAAVLVGAVLAAEVVHLGELGSDGAPMTDNNMVAYIEQHLAPGDLLALDAYMAVPAGYYFRIHHYRPPLIKGAVSPHRVLVLLVGHRTPAAAERLVGQTGDTARATLRRSGQRWSPIGAITALSAGGAVAYALTLGLLDRMVASGT